ncbi:MAG: hypothetical protein ACJAT2_001490 [Bacteriovoracaceae bacterium]|jgi:hypothetical protein
MNSVFEGFTGLIPYMSDPMKFKDPKNKGEIHTHLSTMINAFNKAGHIKTFNLPGINPSYVQVKQHLKETLDAFELGQPDFARVRLRGTGQLCMTCHTQLKPNSGIVGRINQVSRTDFTTDYDYAEFLFLIRSYKKAQRYYEKDIEVVIENTQEIAKISKKRNAIYKGRRIEDSLEKILTIHTKVNYNPSKIIPLLEKYNDHKNISDHSKQRITSWINSLKEWKKIKKIQINRENQLDKFLSNYVSKFETEVAMQDGTHDVTLLIASGVLYKHLLKKPKGETGAKLLYWISKIDHILSNTYLYSLSELYLKRCITEYSKSPWARKCYNSYEDQISLGYTGSSGKFIPDDELKEMKRLKSFLKN